MIYGGRKASPWIGPRSHHRSSPVHISNTFLHYHLGHRIENSDIVTYRTSIYRAQQLNKLKHQTLIYGGRNASALFGPSGHCRSSPAHVQFACSLVLTIVLGIVLKHSKYQYRDHPSSPVKRDVRSHSHGTFPSLSSRAPHSHRGRINRTPLTHTRHLKHNSETGNGSTTFPPHTKQTTQNITTKGHFPQVQQDARHHSHGNFPEQEPESPPTSNSQMG